MQFQKLLFTIYFMLTGKRRLIIGLTTFHNEMLRISVPALSRTHQKFLLIIYNDNPQTKITTRQIRRLGYHGQLHIINTHENVGLMRARLAIIKEMKTIQPHAEWVIFAEDDDILSNIEIPHVGSDNFAIIQNAVAVHGSLADLMCAIKAPNECCPDGKNITLLRPNIGLAGTPVRAGIMTGMADIAGMAMDKIREIDGTLEYLPPVNAIMWSWANMYTKHLNPTAAPIFMDRVNYIKNCLDTTNEKYGRRRMPGKNAAAQYANAAARYDAAFLVALSAAPAGQ